MLFFFKKALHYREGCEILKLFWGEQQPSECQTASGGCNFFALMPHGCGLRSLFPDSLKGTLFLLRRSPTLREGSALRTAFLSLLILAVNSDIHKLKNKLHPAFSLPSCS
jgi:hypothetical protein